MLSTAPVDGPLGSASMTGVDKLKTIAHSKKLTEQQKVAEGTRQFESAMLRQVLQDSLKPLVKGYLNEEGSAHSIYRYFMIDSLAEAMTQNGGVGLSHVLQAQIAGRKPVPRDAEGNPLSPEQAKAAGRGASPEEVAKAKAAGRMRPKSAPAPQALGFAAAGTREAAAEGPAAVPEAAGASTEAAPAEAPKAAGVAAPVPVAPTPAAEAVPVVVSRAPVISRMARR